MQFVVTAIVALVKRAFEALTLWATDWVIQSMKSMFSATKQVSETITSIPGIEMIPQLWNAIPLDMKELVIRCGVTDGLRIIVAAAAARFTVYAATLGRI